MGMGAEMLRSVLKIAAVALLLTGAAADPAAKPDPATASHLAAALDVMDALNAKATFMVVVESVSSTMLANIKQTHPEASDKAVAEFHKAFKDEMVSQTDELMKMQAAVYAEHFSEADLKALAAFYRSDVGKRFVSEQPAIIKEVTPLALKWGMQAGQNAAQRAMEKLQKEGITL